MLDFGIDTDVWPWVWLVVAVAFALIELALLGSSFVLLPFALSAFIASMLAFYDVAVEVQWAVFVLGGAIAFAVFYRWARGHLTDELPLGVGADRLVGMEATVVRTISPDDPDRAGRVAVDGEVWGALCDVPMTMAVGSHVRVAAMRGTRVVVEPLTPPPTDRPPPPPPPPEKGARP
jgi:membrane protein implicated in regulation of membrane protease activity